MTEDMDTSTTKVSKEKIPYSTRIKFLNIIAKPLASKSLTKKIYKLVKKGRLLIILYYYYECCYS